MLRMDGSTIHVYESAFRERDLLTVIELLDSYIFPRSAATVHRHLREMGYEQSWQVTVSMLGVLEFDERVRCYYLPFSSQYYPLKLYRTKRVR